MTDEERLLRDTAGEFARRSVAPTAIERDEAERFDRSIFAGMGELGLTGAPLPESVGGSGFSYIGWSLVMQVPWKLPVRPVVGLGGVWIPGAPGSDLISTFEAGLVWQAW